MHVKSYAGDGAEITNSNAHIMRIVAYLVRLVECVEHTTCVHAGSELLHKCELLCSD